MSEPSARLKTSYYGGGIFARYRVINAVLFAVVSLLISVTMLFVLKDITDKVSKDYAKLQSSITAATLNTYFEGQIALVKKAARSTSVIEWFADESDEEKKNAAYMEIMEITTILPNANLYFVIEESLNEFMVRAGDTIGDIKPFAVIDPEDSDDAWYFECTASDYDYLLKVDIDEASQRKRVWLNYKVKHGDKVEGILCAWLDFSDIVEQIFLDYDNEKARWFVMDENGLVHMDSARLEGEDFQYYSIDDSRLIEDEITDSVFLVAAAEYIKAIDGLFEISDPPLVIDLTGGKYRYSTIAPIASTTWSVVTLYNASSLFNASMLLPMVIIVFVILSVYILVTDILSRRLIFMPFEELTQSISHIASSREESVFGIGRQDEIGDIANTIQGMKETLSDAIYKSCYDALTGIYNRRYLEENLSRIIMSLSRSSSMLCVMMVDVDYFKKYNDTYGHSMGDDCLIVVSHALTACITRADDFVARYGGEEFVLILPHTDEKGARIIANRILNTVSSCNLPHESSDVADHVTVSIGVTMAQVEHEQKAEDYIKRADEALYLSKNQGRNRYTYLPFDDQSQL